MAFDLCVLLILTFDLFYLWPFDLFDLCVLLTLTLDLCFFYLWLLTFWPMTFDLKLLPWHFTMWCCVTVLLLFQCWFSNIYRYIAVLDMIYIIDIMEIMFWLPPFATAFLMQCCKAEFLILWRCLWYCSTIYRLRLNLW